MVNRFLCGFLVLTYACNNRCKWCYAAPAGFKPRVMSFETADRVMDLMSELGVKDVGLIGGEPTVYPKVEELIKRAKAKGLRPTLYSNGRMLANKEFANKIAEAGPYCVNVSVQCGSGDKEKHDATVGVKGAWEETTRGIDNCFRLGLRLGLETVLCHSDLGVYKRIIDEFAYTRAKFIFYRQVPVVNEGLLRARVLSNKATKEAFKKVYAYARRKGVDAYLFSRMPLCWWDESDETEKRIMRKVVSRCHVLSGRNLVVDVDGKVLPCPQWIGLHSMDLLEGGVVKPKERFLEEWNEGAPKRVRENLLYYPHEKCVECKFYGKKCTGGCPLVPFEIGPFAPV